MTTYLSLAILLLAGAQILHLIQHVMEGRARSARATALPLDRLMDATWRRQLEVAIKNQREVFDLLYAKLDRLEDAVERGARRGINQARIDRIRRERSDKGGAA